MARRLALCFDGTWDAVKAQTNVYRIYAAINAMPRARRGDSQIKYYDAGVGTGWYDRVRGGTLGRGVSETIRQGYAWLIEHYQDGSEIFLFGFSRGAFSARSLGGLIGRCGAPFMPTSGNKKDLNNFVKEAYKEAIGLG